jgi:hypothetical protein
LNLLVILDALPAGLRPYAKAVVPAAVLVVAAVLHGIAAGNVGTPELELALVGFAAASITFCTTNLPEGWRAYAKAIAPAAVTIVAVPVHLLVTGEWNAAEWTLAIGGLGSALLTFIVPNEATPEVIYAHPGAPGITNSDVLAVPALPDESAGDMRTARARAAADEPPTRPVS